MRHQFKLSDTSLGVPCCMSVSIITVFSACVNETNGRRSFFMDVHLRPQSAARTAADSTVKKSLSAIICANKLLVSLKISPLTSVFASHCWCYS